MNKLLFSTFLVFLVPFLNLIQAQEITIPKSEELLVDGHTVFTTDRVIVFERIEGMEKLQPVDTLSLLQRSIIQFADDEYSYLEPNREIVQIDHIVCPIKSRAEDEETITYYGRSGTVICAIIRSKKNEYITWLSRSFDSEEWEKALHCIGLVQHW